MVTFYVLLLMLVEANSTKCTGVHAGGYYSPASAIRNYLISTYADAVSKNYYPYMLMRIEVFLYTDPILFILVWLAVLLSHVAL